MFDLATQPLSLPQPGTALGVPFDWRLTAAAGLANYPYSDFATPDSLPVVDGEMLATYALALEDGLQTAVVLSLFTDSRADRDAVLPLNQTDRRGWVGDEFMGDAPGARADVWGSALWLVHISKVTPDVLERARFAAQEALAWLVRDGIASRVEVSALWAGPALDRLAIRASIYKPDELAPVYDVLWGTSLRRLDAQVQPDNAVACCDPPAPAAPPPPSGCYSFVYGGFKVESLGYLHYQMPLNFDASVQGSRAFLVYLNPQGPSNLGVPTQVNVPLLVEGGVDLGYLCDTIKNQLPGFDCFISTTNELVLQAGAPFAVQDGAGSALGLWDYSSFYTDFDNNSFPKSPFNTVLQAGASYQPVVGRASIRFRDAPDVGDFNGPAARTAPIFVVVENVLEVAFPAEVLVRSVQAVAGAEVNALLWTFPALDIYANGEYQLFSANGNASAGLVSGYFYLEAVLLQAPFGSPPVIQSEGGQFVYATPPHP